MKNKKGFLDTEILTSTGFVLLAAFALGATLTGYIMGKRMGFPPFPVWQLIVIMVGEVIAAYVFAARG